MKTFRDVVLARREDPRPAILSGDDVISYAQFVQGAADRASLFAASNTGSAPHIGVLLDNVPEFPLWIGAASLVGATIVGINPTRRGAELARDIRHTDCQMIVTESNHEPLLNGLDLGIPPEKILSIDSAAYTHALAPHANASVPERAVDADTQLLLLFTSGTSGAPKAVICSQGKLAATGEAIQQIAGLHDNTVSYQVMPMFHSNALFAGYAPTVVAGAATALRRKFSASGFLPDVRHYKATYFNYVGKPLSYILATPEAPEDGDNTLEYVFGNEGADLDLERFSERFRVPVKDGYGSTEGGTAISRTEEMPQGALGVADPSVKVMDPDTNAECPPARFDEQGRITNPEEATGEIVNTAGAGMFEGYYRNDEANQTRMRGGWYWTGDLGYRDEDGYFYFAGRDYEWLRVDGENFAAAPVERILARYPDVILAAVYAVPDAEVGDQVMAAIQVKSPEAFDPGAFDHFLADQPDLGTKWSPRYVRITRTLPVTHTSKVQKRQLRAQRWECDEPVYFRPARDAHLRSMTPEDATALQNEFAARGRPLAPPAATP